MSTGELTVTPEVIYLYRHAKPWSKKHTGLLAVLNTIAMVVEKEKHVARAGTGTGIKRNGRTNIKRFQMRSYT
jgi:hypothetical protein